MNVSIIIPFYVVDDETVQMTLDCIDAFRKTMAIGDELILVDDCSPFQHTIPTTIRHKENLGNAPAWNTGLRHATKDYILFADNDTVPAKWRDEMIAGLAKYSIVFPVIYNERVARDERMLAGMFFMFHKNLIRDIGTFDESYGSYFEDTDFFKRAMLKGHTLGVIEGTSVIHKSQGTFSKIMTQEALEKLFLKNRDKYEEKWGREYPFLSTEIAEP